MGEEREVALSDVIRSYSSPLLLRQLAERGSSEQHREPREETAVVAAIDVEGFSRLAEALSKHGPAGIEKLVALIDECFGSAVDAVEDHGGIVETFAGDAVYAIWPIQNSDLVRATHNAAMCARELTVAAERAPGLLRLKASVAIGSLSTAHVGGFNGRWELLATGEAFTQLGSVSNAARRGKVLLSRPAWKLLRECGASAAEEHRGFPVLQTLPPAPRIAPATPAQLPGEGENQLREYLPDGLPARLEFGQGDWLGEFRRLAVVFVQVSGPKRALALDSDRANQAFRCVQQPVYELGGGVLQFCHDDKGVVAVAAMGLPGMAHEDDAERALLAALAIQDGLGEMKMAAGVGVATGRVFCGALGNRRRRQYSAVGSVVNLAARLMGSGKASVLCDAETRAAVTSRFGFGKPHQIDVKGFDSPVQAYCPSKAGTSAVVPQVPRWRRPGDLKEQTIVGREAERAQLSGWLRSVVRGEGSVVAIRGEAGIGKSVLATDVANAGREAGLEVSLGFCDTLNATLAYRPWRSVLEQTLELRGLEARDDRSAVAIEYVTEVMGDADLAPLLSAVLPVEIAENPITKQMVGAVRRDNTVALLASLIRHAAERYRARGNTLLVVLEDAHWMDSASWALLDSLRRSQGLPLGIAVTMRPIPSIKTPATESFFADEKHFLDLDVLSAEATAELVRRRLGANEITMDLADVVFRRAQGNPFFSLEITAALWEMELIRVTAGVARLDRGDQSIDSIVPDSVSGVVESRIDRLSEELQLTLKTASVIGQRIRISLLRAIHPMESAPEVLDRQLQELDVLDLVRKEPGGAYFFQHAITRDVVYNRMLFAQRRRLHRATAEALEKGDAPGAIRFYHWREAGEVARALDYVDAPGTNALRQGHYHEAIEFFRYALESPSSARATVSPNQPTGEIPRTALWSKQLGEAQVAIGRHGMGRDSLEAALHGLGHPVPQSELAVCLSVARELARQVTHRLLPRWIYRTRRVPSEWLVTSAEAYEQLGYIYYASGETLRGVYGALKMLNLSERAALSSVLARSYAVAAMAAAVTPLRGVVSLYEKAAGFVANELGDSSTEAYVGWIAAVRAAGEGDWDRVESGAGAALEPAARLNDWRLQMMSLETLASGAIFQGDFERARELSQAQLAIAGEQANRLWEAWALNSLTEATRAAGEDKSAVERCQRALPVVVEEADREEEIRANGMLAASLSRLGRFDEALTAARRTADLIARTDLTSFVTYEGFAGVCEVMLNRAEAVLARGGIMPPALWKDTERSVLAFVRFARVFPVGRPRSMVMRARLLALRGKRRRAERALGRAVAEAERLRMPQEKGIAQLTLGGFAWLPEKKRIGALERALAVLPPGFERREAERLVAELAP